MLVLGAVVGFDEVLEMPDEGSCSPGDSSVLCDSWLVSWPEGGF